MRHPSHRHPLTPPRPAFLPHPPAARAANNAARPPDEVDLHGLHVSEAIARADAAIASARARGAPRLTLIVGRGAHSAGGVARIRPAVERELIRKHSLRVTPGVPNKVRRRSAALRSCLALVPGALRWRCARAVRKAWDSAVRSRSPSARLPFFFLSGGLGALMPSCHS